MKEETEQHFLEEEHYAQLVRDMMNLKAQVDDLQYILHKKIGGGSADVKASIVSPSNVPSSAIANASVTQSKVSYETVTLAFGSTDTSKTAAVTSGDIIIGYYESVVTGAPATGELQLSISGPTLTGTRSASPGGTATITYTIILLKA